MNKTKISGIYGLHNRITNKWYIGASIDIDRRWHRGYKLLQCKKQRKIYNALIKYGYDAFDKIILEMCNKNDFKKRETYWIEKYNSVDSGYNLAPGGEGGFRPLGIPCSPDTKRKISLANKGNKHSEECKKLMSLKRKGIPKPDGFGNLISRALTGKKLTKERKQNISKSLMGRKWSEKRKETIDYHGKNHPRWTPLSNDNQSFIRNHYLTKSENWIRLNMPEKISQKKLHLCILNLKQNPDMAEITDFV